MPATTIQRRLKDARALLARGDDRRYLPKASPLAPFV
jgi:hypothetical protein